MGSKLNIYLVS